MPET